MFPAHTFGKRYDLPIPLYVFVGAGVAVVLVVFLLVRLRLVATDGAIAQLPDRAPEATMNIAAAAASRGALALFGLCGLLGSNTVAENILLTTFWLVAWIVVPLSAGLLGDWTRQVNPYAHLVRLAGPPGVRRVVLGRSAPLAYPSWLGWWPAVAAFFALSCGESDLQPGRGPAAHERRGARRIQRPDRV
jgi:hypothetical protein